MGQKQEYPRPIRPAFTRKDFSIKPGWVLEARAEELSVEREVLTEYAEDTLSVIIFRAAMQLNAFSLDQVLEVVQPFTITPVPDVPGFVLGVANLRGTIVTVIDLALILGLGRTHISSESQLIVVDDGKLHCSFPTDDEARVAVVRSSCLQEPAELPYEEMQPFLKGILRDNNDLIPLIDVSKVLQSDQFVSLCE